MILTQAMAWGAKYQKGLTCSDIFTSDKMISGLATLRV